MKAIRISKSVLSSSSFRNSCAYLARSSRLAAVAKKDHMVRLDQTIKFRPATDWLGRSVAWADSETDTLQYYLAYSNSSLYNPEDLKSMGRGREVTAENLEATASTLQTRAAKIAARASVLMDQFHQYRSKRYWEAGRLLMEEVEYLEEEATRLLNTATDLREQADFYYGEAEAILEEEKYISKWEELYDMM